MIPDLIRYILMVLGGLCVLTTVFLCGMMLAGHFYDKHKAHKAKALADSDFNRVWGWNDADRH